MKTLNELYKSILSSVGMVVDGQGFVSTLLPGSDTSRPFTVEGKRLVLPTQDQLRQSDWSNRIGFHPLLQSLTGGESRVMEKFRERMNGYTDFILGMLLVDIAQLGVKKEMHKDLTPAQASYLGPFSDADEKFVKLLTDLVSTKRPLKKNFEFVRFNVIKGRMWQGQKRSRVAVMHFPLYEALPKENKTATILGHKLRVADVKMLRNMYEFLFMGIREDGYYEIGSDSKIAPSIESLMAVYAKFIDVVNTAVAILEPVINTSNALLIVDDWRDDFARLSEYLPEINKIPLLEGNVATERVAQAAAPQRINDEPIAQPRPVAAPDHAPILGSTVNLNTTPVQEAKQVQHTPSDSGPRFKLGTRSPTVTSENATHQISDAVAKQVQTIGYARPSAASLPPTPPVGAILQQQQPPQQQQVFAQPQQQFAGNVLANQQVQQPQIQAMKVPETARLINGALYIPVEGQGVSVVPANAVMVDGRLYVPLAAAGAPVMGGGVVAPMQQRFGMPMQQQVTDPAQVPGLTEQEIVFYRSNPVMFQNFLQQQFAGAAAQANNVLIQRQQQVPRYLQNAVQAAQQQQMNSGNFFRR